MASEMQWGRLMDAQQSELLVDSILPQQVLLLQGKYVQTVAHLEKLMWYILFVAEGYDVEDLDDVHAALKQQQRTTELIGSLRAALKADKVHMADEVTAILNEVERDKDARNMAVHGAWSTLPDGTFRCDYFKNLGSSKQPDWRGYNAPVTLGEIEAALTAANRLLSAAHEVFQATFGKKSRGSDLTAADRNEKAINETPEKE